MTLKSLVTKKILKITSEEQVDIKYGHILKVLCDWIDAWVMVIVGGRGLAKSSEVQAERTINVLLDMPGAPTAFVCDTYVNLSTNIMPAVKMGWKRKGYFEGVHYVCNTRPPDEWLKRCSIIVDDFKHTTFWYNGAVIFGGSLDRPSLLAGKSVVHMFIDEAKFQEDSKIDRAFPILRGDAIRYGYSQYFLGMTITTDMPDVTANEYDWVLRFVKRMNPDRIMRIIQAYDQYNKLLIKMLKESQKSAVSSIKVKKLEKELNYWNQALHKLRHQQTFFLNAGSLVNIYCCPVKIITA